MSLASQVARYVSLRHDARSRWLALVEEVQAVGDRGHDTRPVEAELGSVGRREAELGRKALRAVVALARSQGIEYSSAIPLAVAGPGGLLVVTHDDRGEPMLVVVPAERVVRG